MKRESKRTLTPRLRFPEFREAPAWDEALLEEVADFVSERISLSQLDLTSYVSTESILADFGGVTRANNLPASGSATRYNANDVLIANIRPYLKKVWHANRSGGASNDVIVVRGKPKLLPAYFPFLLRNDSFIDYVMRGAKGVKMPRGDIALMKAFAVRYPSPAEQRKIAACLGSLDEWIGAEGRKLEALRSHKKGLMQQLFPRPGETRPRLRFPEFRTAGEWEENPLSKVAENLDNRRVPITEKDRTKGTIPYYGASGIVDHVDDYIFDEDLLCISEDGANLVTRTYPIAFSISGKTWVNNHAHVLRFDDPARQTLVEVYLNATDLRDFITGMAQPKLNRGMLDTIPIPLPPTSAEQHRIAACLSSLDELITAQSRKLDGLRVHKKGLMQRLFP